jgi:hypothetical protein
MGKKKPPNPPPLPKTENVECKEIKPSDVIVLHGAVAKIKNISPGIFIDEAAKAFGHEAITLHVEYIEGAPLKRVRYSFAPTSLVRRIVMPQKENA